MSLAAIFKGRGPSGFGYGSTAMEVVAGCDLAGRTMLVTGCGSGLGLETIRALASRGARIVAAARTVDKARAACDASTMKGDFSPGRLRSLRTGVHPGLHRRREERRRTARRDRVQRRRHGAAEAAPGPRLRAAVLHQPHRPLHPGDGAARSTRARRAGRGRREQRPPPRPGRGHRVRQPLRRARLLADARLRAVEARQRPLHA